MYVVAAKAGLILIVVIAFLRAIQTESIGDVVVASAAAGIIPGTNVAVPAELLMVATAAALMVITALVCRSYAREQAVIRKFMPEFRNDREDPEYRALVPGLGKAITFSRVIKVRAGELQLRALFWWKYMGRPLIAQAIAVHQNVRIPVRIDRWGSSPANLHRNVLSLLAAFRRLGSKVRDYLARVTMF